MSKIFGFVRIAGNVLLHSLRTATFCWVAVGLVVAVLAIRGIIRKKKCKKRDCSYSLEGMSLGMCLGLLVGTMFEGYIVIGISVGMIVGLVIGMCIPKKQEEEGK